MKKSIHEPLFKQSRTLKYLYDQLFDGCVGVPVDSLDDFPGGELREPCSDLVRGA